MSQNAPYTLPMEAARQNLDQLGIRFEELPHLPFWSPLVGRFHQQFKVKIAAKVMASSSAVGRELAQPETDALAQHYATVLVSQAWDTPIVLASTAVMYRRTYAKYGFPFYTPKPEMINKNSIVGIPVGKSGPKIWHGLRLLAWYSCCRLAIGLFVTSYALSIYTANFAGDPRLTDYRKDVQSRLKRPPAQLRRDRTRDEPSEAWPGAEQRTEQSFQDAKSSWPPMQRSQPGDMQDPFKTDEPSALDDASPASSTEQQSGLMRQSAGGESAWDRLRRKQSGGVPAQRTSAWAQKRDDELTSRGAREGTSFSFSSSDEEKSYAKEQAQKDFDEMLEKERRGRG